MINRPLKVTGCITSTFDSISPPHRVWSVEMHTTQPALMSVQAFCAWAGIGRTKVYEEIEEGRLQTVTLGRRRLVPTAEAERWLDRLLEEATGKEVLS